MFTLRFALTHITDTTRPLMKGLVARADGAKHTSEIATTLHCASHPEDSALCGQTPNADLMLARKVTSVLQVPSTSHCPRILVGLLLCLCVHRHEFEYPCSELHHRGMYAL